MTRCDRLCAVWQTLHRVCSVTDSTQCAVWQTLHNRNHNPTGGVMLSHSAVDQHSSTVWAIDHHDTATQRAGAATSSSMAFSHRSWCTLVSVTDTRWPGCHRDRGLMVANFDTSVRDMVMHRVQEVLNWVGVPTKASINVWNVEVPPWMQRRYPKCILLHYDGSWKHFHWIPHLFDHEAQFSQHW